MSDALQKDVSDWCRPAVAAGRAHIERQLHPRRWWLRRLWRWSLEAIGAAAVGILSAGIAVFLTAVVLNLLFHFSP